MKYQPSESSRRHYGRATRRRTGLRPRAAGALTLTLEALEPRRLMCDLNDLSPVLLARVADASARTAAYSDSDHPALVGPVQSESAAGAASSLRFAVIGDFGFAGPAEAAVAARVKSWDPEIVVTVGDNNYGAGSFATIDANIGQYYQEYIGNYRGSYGAGAGAESRFFPSLGNHDWDAPGRRAEPYLNYFTLPQGSSGNERYYDFVRGPVHFFALNSDIRRFNNVALEPDGVTADSVQGQWLRNALAASTAQWKIVYFHHPPVGGGENLDSPYMDWPFKQWGADLVLAGHEHNYERILRPDKAPLVINGLGGRSLYEFIDSQVPAGSVVRYNDDYGAMLVEADASAVKLRAVSHDGQIIDTYTLSGATDRPAAPSGLTATAVAPGQINVTWTDNSNAAGNAEGEFQLERSGNGGQSWTIVANPGPGVTEYHDLGLAGGTNYAYRVAAVNTAGASAFSATDSAAAPSANPASAMLIGAGSTWRFLDNGSNQGTAWRAAEFNDDAWKTGPAQLGYGDGDEATAVSFGPNSAAKFITTYFRKAFNVADPAAVPTLVGQILRDDGAVVYLNGTEVYRKNMPAGAVTSATLAVRNSDTSVFHRFNLSPDLLRAGGNVLAVEVHQFLANSSDLSFDLSLAATGVWGAAVNGLAAVPASAGQINLSWRDDFFNDAPAGSALRYRVERSADGIHFAPRATVGPGVTTFADAGLSPSSLYYYRVTAFLESTGVPPARFQGESRPATASATTRPAGPTGDVVNVAPDPRPAASPALNTLTIAFSEPVTGLTLSDLKLSREAVSDGTAPNLLTAAQTLTTDDNVTWVLGNLSGLTADEGRYVLLLDPAGAGVTDLTGGDPLTERVGEAWVVDLTPPPTPTPPDLAASHDSGSSNADNLTRLPAVVISGFSEALNLVKLFDVTGGGSVFLNSTRANDVSAWALATPALSEGVHDFAAETVDAAGNVSARSPALRVTIDLTAPAASIAPVAPDPRTSPVNSVTIAFSEPVTGLDLADLRLTRDGGEANLLGGALPAPTLTTTDNGLTWTLAGLAGRTAAAGAYALSVLAPTTTDVRDRAGNALAAAVTETWQTTASTAVVVGRRVFYNRSAWDGNNAAAGASDDAAIAPDKRALLPGQTAVFANYTSYTRGINGVMIDVAELPEGDALNPADFTFRAGNDDTPADWAPVAVEPSVTVRRGAGPGGTDRVTLVWPDNAVQKTWLQVTMKSTDNTGLPSPDVFYFGNAIAESGNNPADAKVTPADELGARSNPRGSSNPAPVDFRWDYNRDKLVNSGDQLAARNNQTTSFTALKLITVPAGGALRAGAARGSRQPTSAWSTARPVLFFGNLTTPLRRWAEEFDAAAR